MDLNLSKEATRSLINLSLSKAGYEDGIEAKVNIIIDSSGSMENLYRNGTVQALVDRALAVGYKFDDDGNIDVFQFSHAGTEEMLDQATQDDHGSYMRNVKRIDGGTAYAPVVEMMTDFYYKGTTEKKGGFFGLFGKTVESAPEGRDGMEDQFPVFSIFITDGGTQTPYEDRPIMDKLLKQHPDMFIQFIALRDPRWGADFSFLRDMEQRHDNCGFAEIADIRTITDEALMLSILSEKAKKVLTK